MCVDGQLDNDAALQSSLVFSAFTLMLCTCPAIMMITSQTTTLLQAFNNQTD
jgi:hypothetical protein